MGVARFGRRWSPVVQPRQADGRMRPGFWKPRMEVAAFVLQSEDDPKIAKMLDEAIDEVAAA